MSFIYADGGQGRAGRGIMSAREDPMEGLESSDCRGGGGWYQSARSRTRYETALHKPAHNVRGLQVENHSQDIMYFLPCKFKPDGGRRRRRTTSGHSADPWGYSSHRTCLRCLFSLSISHELHTTHLLSRKSVEGLRRRIEEINAVLSFRWA